MMPFIDIPLEIEILTPTHIGCGEDYVPTDYFIDKQILYVLDREKYLTSLKNKGLFQKFLEVSGKSILEIRTFIFNNRDLNSVSYRVPVSQEVEKKYIRNIQQTSGSSEQHVLNQLKFEKLLRSGFTNHVYIPGSSIKGSFKTAILNHIGKSEFVSAQEFGRIFSVSDFILRSGKAVIKEVKNYKNSRGESGQQNLMQISEVIQPGSVFCGNIRLNLFLNKNLDNIYHKETDLDPANFDKDFFSLLNKFYKQDVLPKESLLFNVYQNFPKTEETLIRLGKHSGAYAMTSHPYQRNNIFNNQLCETVKKIVETSNSELYFKSQLLKTKASKIISEYERVGYNKFVNSLYEIKNSRKYFNKKNKLFFMDIQTTIWTVDGQPMGWCKIRKASAQSVTQIASSVKMEKEQSASEDLLQAL